MLHCDDSTASHLEPDPAPALPEGLELIGRFEGSGFKDPPYIVRRPDGQVVQLPELLYRLLELIDAETGPDELARRMSEAIGRGVDGDAVRLLIDEKLRPLGVVAAPDGSTPDIPKLDPLLALKFRAAVVPERVTRAITRIFQPLFFPPVVIAVVAGLVGVDDWLLFRHGISQSIRSTIYDPALLLVLIGGVIVATAFHEIGHATACRYGGARPGVIGVGIYVVWPAFYTDVTDAYRLGRLGRLRTDLGGVYFNAIFALVVTAIYVATDAEFVLALVLIQNFAIVQQLLPLLRLDGYYIISDLTGVPDILGRVKPILGSLLPGRPSDARVTALKVSSRVAVTAYVCSVVPVMIMMMLLMVVHAPRVFATAYASVRMQWFVLTHAHGLATLAAGGIQAILLILPCAGMLLTGGRIGWRASSAAWRWSDGDPVRRTSIATLAAAGIGLAAFTWWPNGDYRPIQRVERGTLNAGIADLLKIPSGRPSLSAARAADLDRSASEAGRHHGSKLAQPASAGGPSSPSGGVRDQAQGEGTGEGWTAPHGLTAPGSDWPGDPPAPGATTAPMPADTTTSPTDTTTTPTSTATTTDTTPTDTTTTTTPTDTTTTTTPTDTTTTTTPTDTTTTTTPTDTTTTTTPTDTTTTTTP
jgi:putative peptide zinc metalloprotease protein